MGQNKNECLREYRKVFLLILYEMVYMVGDIELTVLIVNYNTADLLGNCIGKLRESVKNISHEIIIIDNASTDESVMLLKRDFSDCELIFNDKNVGFGRANNQCVPFIKGRYVLLLNTDAFVSEETINKTIQYMDDNERCGILGVKLLGRDGELQPSCRYFPTPFNIFLQRTGLKKFFKEIQLVDDMAWGHDVAKQCDWVPGCYYLIRREVVDTIGLFDPRYFLYYEEVDHCFATKKAGWEVHYFSDTSVIHIGGESAKSEGGLTSSGRQLEVLQIESELLYFRKNYGQLTAMSHVLLLSLADMIMALKKIMRGKFKLSLIPIKHACLVWTLYFKTDFATTPTR